MIRYATTLYPTPERATQKRLNQPGGKLLHLEGLRGIAAYAVFLLHFLSDRFCNYDRFCRKIPLLGQDFNFYVALFFILSGRVLCASVLRKALATGPTVPIFKQLATSLLKRPLRLGLPLTVATIMQTIMGREDDGPFTLLQTFVSPIYFIFTNIGINSRFPIPGNGWTMSHELLGSFVVYGLTMLLLTVSSTRGRTVILFTSFVFASFGHSWTAHFILGLIFNFAAEEKWFAILKRKWKLVYIFKWALVVLTFILFFESPISVGGQVRKFLTSYQLNVETGHLGVDENVFWQENIATMCIAAVIMLMVETTDILQYFLSTTFPLYLARISFMLYLTHEMLYVAPTGYWITFYDRDDLVSRWLHFIIVNICLFITSDFFTVTIDQPCVELTNFVARTVVSDTWTMQQVVASIPCWPHYIWNYLLYILQNIKRTYYGYFFTPVMAYKMVEIESTSPGGRDLLVSDEDTYDGTDPFLHIEAGK